MSIIDRARQLRAVIEENAGKMTDTRALDAPELFPMWSGAGVFYEVGKRVRYEGVLYKCLQAHTAQADWTPAAAPSLWARVLIPDENTIPEWVQPDSTNGYKLGDKVRHKGKIWESIVENNIWEPGVYGWGEGS